MKVGDIITDIEKNSTMIQEMIGIIQDPEVLKLMELMHKLIYPYYLEYVDSSGLMHFESFVNFCRDFSVFPDLVSKPGLHRIFHSLSSSTS